MAIELDLTDRTAIVTGAGRGIGAVIATRLADAGADLVLAARSEDELEATAEAVEAEGRSVAVVPTDLADVSAIEALVERTRERFGAPEILVNNAAANLAGDPLSQTVGDVDTMLAVNLRGLFLLSQRVANAMIDADVDTGRIVNVSSVAGHVGIPAMTVYSGTKAGVYGITRGLAAELAPRGITVNSVSPGMIRVERIEGLMAEKGELYDLDRIPVGRLGRPGEIADVCAFLASDLASYVTGVDLLVDGGVSITAGLYR